MMNKAEERFHPRDGAEDLACGESANKAKASQVASSSSAVSGKDGLEEDEANLSHKGFDEIQRERRLELNRASARARRKRKKDALETLSKQVSDLNAKLEISESENKRLRAHTLKLESALQQADITIATLSRQGSHFVKPPPYPTLRNASAHESQSLQQLLHTPSMQGNAVGSSRLGSHSVRDSERALHENIQRLISKNVPSQAYSHSSLPTNTPASMGRHNDPILRAMFLSKSQGMGFPGMK